MRQKLWQKGSVCPVHRCTNCTWLQPTAKDRQLGTESPAFYHAWSVGSQNKTTRKAKEQGWESIHERKWAEEMHMLPRVSIIWVLDAESWVDAEENLNTNAQLQGWMQWVQGTPSLSPTGLLHSHQALGVPPIHKKRTALACQLLLRMRGDGVCATNQARAGSESQGAEETQGPVVNSTQGECGQE